MVVSVTISWLLVTDTTAVSLVFQN